MAEVVDYAFEELAASEPPPRDAGERLLARARAEAEQIREAARAEGYREGLERARGEAASQLASALETLAEAQRGVLRSREELLQALEQDAVELAIELAGKIAEASGPRMPAEQLLAAVRGALRRLSDRRRIVVLVNPGELATVTGVLEELRQPGSGIELCELLSDERVPRGGAIVRTAEGEVDASVATQLERAREVVEASLQSLEASR